MGVPYRKVVQDNGLTVIVHEDRRVPLVAVSVWYRVGSRHEAPGRTGLAHLVEHLMFKGALHQPDGYFAPLEAVGAAVNGSTSVDRTNYWEVVPAEAARLALWMEADRMGWMRPALDSARFETERQVVINERRERYENRRFGRVPFAIADAMFGDGHPYAWPTIGRAADLPALTLEHAAAFLDTYYQPANASLAVAGDVDASALFDWAAECFGPLAAGPRHPPPVAVPVAPSGRRLVMEDRIELPRLYAAWPTPASFAPADAPLDLAADVLSNGRTSRLYRRLVFESTLAIDIAASQGSRDLTSLFQLAATAAPGRTLEAVADGVTAELRRLAAEGPTEAEVARGRIGAEAAFVYRVQSLGGFGGKADQLNAYEVQQGEPDGFDADRARYLGASPDDVRNAVARWLRPEDALWLSVVPMGRADLALPGSEPAPPDR